MYSRYIYICIYVFLYKTFVNENLKKNVTGEEKDC